MKRISVLITLLVAPLCILAGPLYFSDKNPDAHISFLMGQQHLVYEIKEDIILDASQELQTTGFREGWIGTNANEVFCNYNLSKLGSGKLTIPKGHLLIARRVGYKTVTATEKSPYGYMYQIDVKWYDANFKPLDDFPVQGLIGKAKKLLDHPSDMLIGGTGGGPIIPNNDLDIRPDGTLFRKASAK